MVVWKMVENPKISGGIWMLWRDQTFLFTPGSVWSPNSEKWNHKILEGFGMEETPKIT